MLQQTPEQTPAPNTSFRTARKLAGKGGNCGSQWDCIGILDCCFGIGSDGTTGLCYPKCNGVQGEYCNANYICGAFLKCCDNECVRGTDSQETCLAPQEQLAVLKRQIEAQQAIEVANQQQLQYEITQTPTIQNQQNIANLQNSLLEIEASKIRQEQESLRLSYLSELEREQAQLNSDTQSLQQQANVVNQIQGQVVSQSATGVPYSDGDRFYQQIQSLKVQEEGGSTNGPTTPAIIGAAIGGLLLIIIFGVAARFIFTRQQFKKNTSGRVFEMNTNGYTDQARAAGPATPTQKSRKDFRVDSTNHSIFMTEGNNNYSQQPLDHSTNGMVDADIHMQAPDILDYNEKQLAKMQHQSAQQHRSSQNSVKSVGRKAPTQNPQDVFYH